MYFENIIIKKNLSIYYVIVTYTIDRFFVYIHILILIFNYLYIN